jgi:hypothetical protein
MNSILPQCTSTATDAAPIVLCKSFNASDNSEQIIELVLESLELCRPSPNRNETDRLRPLRLTFNGCVTSNGVRSAFEIDGRRGDRCGTGGLRFGIGVSERATSSGFVGSAISILTRR